VSLQKRIAALEAAAGATCRACELVDASRGRSSALIAEVAASRPADNSAGELVSYTARSSCAWCGRVVTEEKQMGGDAGRDLETFYQGIDAGRMHAPEVAGAYERLIAGLREWFGERVGEWDAIGRELASDMTDLPPPRFPYACAVAGCYCTRPKRAAA
jgi:hypothetical protein